MRIGFVITNVSFSGAQNVFNAITTELERFGHEIFVFATNETADINQKNENTYGLLSSEGGRYTKQIKKVQQLCFLAKEKQIDAYVSFGFNSNIKTILAGILTKIPTVISDRMDPRNSPGKKAYFLRLERWILYRFASGFVVQTNEIKNFFSASLQKKTYIIPNPVRSKQSINVVCQERKKVIATVTRLDERQKNLVHLIESYAFFQKVHPEYSLAIVGDGPDIKMLQDKALEYGVSDKVEFTGNIEDPIQFIADTDIFTLVSWHEGMPNALIEAMSIGLPCVVEHFSGGAAEELIENDKNGILLPKHNKEELVNALCRVCENKGLKRRLGNNAYKINEQLSLEKISRMWENVIKQSCFQKRRNKEGIEHDDNKHKD